ncbi:MAG: Ig-like domain-containing protein, partial [Gemmataceae bacterium]
STTSLSSSANPSPLGQPVTFTATVASEDPNAPAPTGTVAFYDGTTLLGTGTLTLVNGQWQASFTTSAMGLGTHEILAVYSGDDIFADSAASMEETIDD